MLKSEKLGGVLVNAQHNFAWLTGGRSSGVDLSRAEGAASLLVTCDGKRFVLANNIEMTRMLTEEVRQEDFEPVEYHWQDEKASANYLLETARGIAGGVIALDQTIESRVAPCRYPLTVNEIARYRQLGSDSGTAIRRVIDKIEPGETEIAIAEKLRHELAAGGMTSVVTLVAADERIALYRHPVPTARRWEKLLLLVTCAKRGGLIVSLSRVVCVGDVPAELERKTIDAAHVFACLLAATRPGTTSAELYQVAAKAYSETGFGDQIDLHHQGGAAGYRPREWVSHPQGREIVNIDQAFAWNPSITGTKIEETCIAREHGVEVITASPDFPQISARVNGREYFSPGILSI